MVTVREDMTGWNMWEHGVQDSRLTVIERTDDYIQPSGKHISQWICKCNCDDQNILIVKGPSLKYGVRKSCGCLQKEIAANMCKQRNTEQMHPLSKDENLQLNLEDEHGLYGIGHCHNTGREFYFDMGDYDFIKDYCWTESKDYRCDYYYLRAYDAQTQKNISILQVLGCKYWDHIDRNTFNNRRYNLRPATHSENSTNCSLQKNNTSGVKGVFWHKRMQKWQVQINVKGKRIHIGSFDTIEEATRARLAKAKELHGEFFYDQSLFDMLTEECC